MALHSVSDARNVRYEEGTHDLRNFTARTRDNDNIGTVDDVLIDDRGRARYVCVRHNSSGRHTLVPAGTVLADRANQSVVIPSVEYSDVPDYSHQTGAVDEEYERRLSGAYDRAFDADRYDDRPDYRTRGWGAGTDRSSTNQLERLDRLPDYKVADGDPDPRGWEVLGRDGTTLGEVDFLIGDTGSMRVRYLAVKLEPGIGRGGHVLIPTGHVDLDTDEDRVTSRGLDAACIANLPAYDGGPVTRDLEQKTAAACNQSYEGANRYEHPRYGDDDLWSGDRTTASDRALAAGQAGEVVVRRRDATRPDIDERRNRNTKRL